jgi:phytoene dehydrogenase-like protein
MELLVPGRFIGGSAKPGEELIFAGHHFLENRLQSAIRGPKSLWNSENAPHRHHVYSPAFWWHEFIPRQVQNMQKTPVIIVGAGLAGLCCARELQRRQIPWQLLEAKDRIGGRVQTDNVDGFTIDHGFQVLQTAYPEARRELNYEQLRLRPFSPGALIRTEGRFVEMADPWRRPGKLFSVLFNGVGTFGDRLRLAWLRASLCGRLPERVWQLDGADCSTAEYLRKSLGFSEDIIRRFFRPWFAGVFLEPDLATSCRMFRFLFGTFASGDAALPADGMESIPRQLAEFLPAENIRLNCRVQSVSRQAVTLETGETLPASAVVLAVEGPAARKLTGDRLQTSDVCSTTCFNFAADAAPFPEPLLVLNGDESGPINNLSVISNIAPETAPRGKALISVSLIGDFGDRVSEMEGAVRAQLHDWYGPQTANWRLLKTHIIRTALPRQLPGFGGHPDGGRSTFDGLHLCGDFVSTGSIHSAMLSGRLTAGRVAESLHGGR